jgi:hypothetical protein
MTELLTESFCERCGKRYEFGSSEPMTRSQKTRGLVTGLRQFIMSTDSLQDSLDDAMKAEEEVLAARQIDAFQDTFSFCFDCRRYTCQSCWNDDAGRCRSCVPVPGLDDMAPADGHLTNPMFAPTEVAQAPQLTTAEPWPSAEAGALAWPSEDEVVRPAAEIEVPTGPETAWPADDEPEPLAAEVEVPEPVAEVEPEPEADVEEPIAAAAETAEPEPAPPTPIAPAGPRRDLRETFARGPLVRRPSAEPVPESLAARRSQLDALGIDDPGEGTVSVGQRDALPYRSSGAGSAANSTALAALWDASTRNLESGAQRASLRPCDACGLTVSSTARFCRRCGAPQTLSA